MGLFFRRNRVRIAEQVEPKIEGRKPRVGLCLGGGGARGYAHIGALKAFEECGINFDLCVGTSVGSIIGALYAAGINAKSMEAAGEKLNFKSLRSGFFLTPNDPSKIGRIVTDIIGEQNIEDLPKKFCAVAVDLTQGKQILLDSGSVATAVSSSSCVPLFFYPVVKDSMHLVDGGLLNNIPADVCKMLGADKVVTIDINPTRGSGTNSLGLIDVVKATFDIMSSNSSIEGIRNSDILISPDLSKFSATSKDGYEEMIELGYNAAREKCEEILKLMDTVVGL